jgi:hypothetical protein
MSMLHLVDPYHIRPGMPYRPFLAVLLMGTGIIIGLLMPTVWATFTSQAQIYTGCQTFPQTGHRVCGEFLQYWRQNGGLAQQGYPISEEFVETSELNGRPYTVQYFERAVFELHPENQPPFDVLLSQLGIYQGTRTYNQGFPTASDETPFYEDRTSATGALKSFYNAINRREYQRAYSYFDGAPNPVPELAPPYAQFAAGYANTVSVTLALGINNMTTGAAAGSIYTSLPAAITASHRDGSTHLFVGCYTLRRANEGVSPDPRDLLWRIYSAALSEAPANSPLDRLLAQQCNP